MLTSSPYFSRPLDDVLLIDSRTDKCCCHTLRLKLCLYLTCVRSVWLSAGTVRRRGGGGSTPCYLRKTGPMFTVITAFDSPAEKLSRIPISLTSVQPITSQARSKAKIFTFYKPSGSCTILANKSQTLYIKNIDRK